MSSKIPYLGIEEVFAAGLASVGNFVLGLVNDGATDASEIIQAAIDAAKDLEGGTIYLPYGTYAIGTTLDMSGAHNVRLIGQGATNGGLAGTVLKWIGDEGEPMLLCDGATQTAGCEIRGIAFNGNASASRCLDTRGIVDWRFQSLRLWNAREHNWFIDIVPGYNSQGLWAQSVSIDPYIFDAVRGVLPASNGLVFGAGGEDNDTCESVFDDIQIQIDDGVGLIGGSCDSIDFVSVKIYRVDGTGATGQALIAKAGTNLTGYENWFQGNRFTDMECRILDGSNANFIEVETGTRDPENNDFGMLDQSGTEYPVFANDGVSALNMIRSEEGYRLFKNTQRWGTDGTVALGANVVEPGVPLTVIYKDGRQFRFMRTDAPFDAKRGNLWQDSNGNILIGTMNDARSVVQSGLALVRSGATITQVQLRTNDTERLRIEDARIAAFKPVRPPVYADGTLPTPTSDLYGAYASRVGSGPVWCDGFSWYPLVLNTGGGPVT